MNGALQQRTTLLQSDWNDATQVPDDYDTDLESDWSNRSKIICFFSSGTKGFC